MILEYVIRARFHTEHLGQFAASSYYPRLRYLARRRKEGLNEEDLYHRKRIVRLVYWLEAFSDYYSICYAIEVFYAILIGLGGPKGGIWCAAKKKAEDICTREA